MTTFRERRGLARFRWPRAHRFTEGRGVHAFRHVLKPGRRAMHHESSHFRGHRE